MAECQLCSMAVRHKLSRRSPKHVHCRHARNTLWRLAKNKTVGTRQARNNGDTPDLMNNGDTLDFMNNGDTPVLLNNGDTPDLLNIGDKAY